MQGLLLESAYTAIEHSLLLLWAGLGTSKGKIEGAVNILFIRPFDRTEWIKCKTAGNRSSLIRSSLKPSPPQVSNSNFLSNFSEILYPEFIAQLWFSSSAFTGELDMACKSVMVAPLLLRLTFFSVEPSFQQGFPQNYAYPLIYSVNLASCWEKK